MKNFNSEQLSKDSSDAHSEMEPSQILFKERIVNNSNVEIKEEEKNKLIDKIKLITSDVEKLVKLENGEKLVVETIFFAPDKKQIEAQELKASEEAQEKIDLIQSSSKWVERAEKEFKLRFGDTDPVPSEDEMIEKLTNKFYEESLYYFRQLFVLWANITILRKNSNNDTVSYCSNINLFEDKINLKGVGEIGLDVLVAHIVHALNKKKK